VPEVWQPWHASTPAAVLRRLGGVATRNDENTLYATLFLLKPKSNFVFELFQ